MNETNGGVDGQAEVHTPTEGLVTSKLSDDQLDTLRRYGEVRPTVAGEILFREGDHSYDFIVVLSGRVAIVDHLLGSERELAVGDPREFMAELGLLTGERLFSTAVVREPGSILVVPVKVLHQLIGQDQALGDLIVRTVLRRRQWLVEARSGMQIVGSRSSRDSQRLLEFATRNRLPHVWLDLDSDPLAQRVLDDAGLSRDDTPTVLMRGGELLRRPSNVELARAAGFGSSPEPGKTYDVVVVGAGPAGLAAAVYGASEGLVTAVVDGLSVGGQIGTTARIENYLGFPAGVSGEEFAQRALIQALRFGATLLVPCTASGLIRRGDGYAVQLESGDELVTRSVIIAAGVAYRKLEAAGIERFAGRGVFYTPLTAQDEVRPGEPVVIVGGGNSAGQAAVSLAARGHRVSIVIRGDSLANSMSAYLIDRIDLQPMIEVLPHSTVREAGGESWLERVVVEDLNTSSRSSLRASALFVLIGAEPHAQWLAGTLQLDGHGFIVTGRDLDLHLCENLLWNALDRDPYMLETSLPGVFAGGDIRSDSVKRVASAVGEGSIAVRFVSEYLKQRDRRTAPAPA